MAGENRVVIREHILQTCRPIAILDVREQLVVHDSVQFHKGEDVLGFLGTEFEEIANLLVDNRFSPRAIRGPGGFVFGTR